MKSFLDNRENYQNHSSQEKEKSNNSFTSLNSKSGFQNLSIENKVIDRTLSTKPKPKISYLQIDNRIQEIHIEYPQGEILKIQLN